MDKKEFIFPGTILGIVLIIAIGLIITQPHEMNTFSTAGLATSTTATSSDITNSTSTNATIVAGTMETATHHAPAKSVTYYYPYGKTILSLNQVAGFKNAVSIRPVSVLSDSRCPVEVRCIQAGTVSISLRVSGWGETQTRTLQLGQSLTIFGTHVTFESADPARHVTSEPASGAYRLTFIVEPAS